MKDNKKFKALNVRLQNLLDEQSDLDILLNPLIKWEEKDQSYKNLLDFKYAGMEFDISYKWKEKVQLEKSNQLSGKDYDENILNNNELKRSVYLKLKNRLLEVNKIIQSVIEELLPEEIDYSNAEDIFKS